MVIIGTPTAERHLGELSEALYSLEKPYRNTNVGAAHFAEIQQEVKNVTALLQKFINTPVFLAQP
ncbi:hypothetical protein PN36_16155 [Candidatus Thiomargarita nelsonii]|uniref:Uncharacterized protein n=1 Tax=Candidatus Thiomargarita nelsonii TaxID=1003181 RepID=A0A4E0QQD8_9GAMM|nr:hypothetical protein PN36_16155 [Candidatus Thiomargarita nelsonii]